MAKQTKTLGSDVRPRSSLPHSRHDCYWGEGGGKAEGPGKKQPISFSLERQCNEHEES